MTKHISNKKIIRENSPDKARSIKSPAKPGSVRSDVVERVVREVVNTRTASGNGKESNPHKSKH
jgi:hypothetical protein